MKELLNVNFPKKLKENNFKLQKTDFNLQESELSFFN